MGLDVEFLIKPFVEIPTDEYERIKLEFYDKFPDPEEFKNRYRYPEMFEGDHEYNQGLIVIRELHRFYGIGYERGNWTYIKSMGDWLAIRFGELAELRYGNDCQMYWDEYDTWGKIRPIIDAHWENVQNEPYHGRWVKWENS